MRDHLSEFGDALIVVLTFSAPEFVASYQRDLLAPLTVLIDQTRTVYRAYALDRGSVWRVWGPKVWWEYLRLIAHGRRFSRPREDTLQLGGDFLVGRDGRLVYTFRSHDPADRPTVADLIEAVKRAGDLPHRLG
ncbi:MAG: AhpC/TSA family protein [Candidatus Dormibacteria bacterium]